MVTGFFIAAARTARPLRAPVLAIAAAAAGALLVTIMMMPAAQPMVSVASAAQIRLVKDEHAAVGDYLRAQAEADRAAAAAVDREYADLREAAVAQQVAQSAVQEPQRIAKLEAPKLEAPLRRPLKVVPGGSPAQFKTGPVTAAGPPLQLAAMVTPPASKRPVIERVRSVIATVERIPRWVRVGVQDAADWATDVPAQIIRLPERRFL